MDQIGVSNPDGTKHLLAIKLRVDDKPVLYLGISKTSGRATHAIELAPTMAFRLADWIDDDSLNGWGLESSLRPDGKRPATQAPALEIPDIRADNARVLCFALDVLCWKLPRDYGPAWLVGELAAAGIPIEWDSKAEKFIPKPLVGASQR